MKKILLFILVVSMFLMLCACKAENPPALSVEGIKGISEQASLKCYYNNVAKFEKKADNIFQTNREMWIEYEGVVTLGISMNDLQIDISKNRVTLVLPEVKILSTEISNINEESYIISSDRWLIKNPISTEDQNNAINLAQEKMEIAVMNNEALYAKAKQNAKNIIENYINWIGELGGQEYTIVWKEQGL